MTCDDPCDRMVTIEQALDVVLDDSMREGHNEQTDRDYYSRVARIVDIERQEVKRRIWALAFCANVNTPYES